MYLGTSDRFVVLVMFRRSISKNRAFWKKKIYQENDQKLQFLLILPCIGREIPTFEGKCLDMIDTKFVSMYQNHVTYILLMFLQSMSKSFFSELTQKMQKYFYLQANLGVHRDAKQNKKSVAWAKKTFLQENLTVWGLKIWVFPYCCLFLEVLLNVFGFPREKSLITTKMKEFVFKKRNLSSFCCLKMNGFSWTAVPTMKWYRMTQTFVLKYKYVQDH